MGLVRVNNWSSIMMDQIMQSENKKFEYGTNDCTTWAVKILKSYTDLDWIPTWKNKKEAIAYQKEMPMEERVSKVLGEYRNNINLTQRGDLVQKDKGMKSALGICVGKKVVFLYTEGICYVDLKDCTYSWRI